jgi:hypothetical protein
MLHEISKELRSYIYIYVYICSTILPYFVLLFNAMCRWMQVVAAVKSSSRHQMEPLNPRRGMMRNTKKMGALYPNVRTKNGFLHGL